MSKPKVGFFDFTSCEGCQIELTNYGDSAFLALLDLIDIVEFREAMTETAGNLDIAFIEGSFSREEDRKRWADDFEFAVIQRGQQAKANAEAQTETIH